MFAMRDGAERLIAGRIVSARRLGVKSSYEEIITAAEKPFWPRKGTRQREKEAGRSNLTFVPATGAGFLCIIRFMLFVFFVANLPAFLT